MELALYCPQLGFYERKSDSVGRRGDFYTSVSTGSLFGELLAFQFAEWWGTEFRSQNSEVRIVEVGAHDGKLAADILRWLREHRPELFARLNYVIHEPSEMRRAWQAATLREFTDHVRWHNSTLDARRSTLPTIFFSNELFDAFPVHRLGWDARAQNWFEWGVACDCEKFIWMRLPLSTINYQLSTSSALLAALPDGYTIEVSPAAENFYRTAAENLSHGKLVTIDYGHATADEVFAPGRLHGTLRAYRDHRVSDDLLAHVGAQDLTAHVNFSALQTVGEQAGLRTESFQTQAQFLTAIAARAWKNPATFSEWDAAHTRQFQTLTHPEHLGRAFRVLVQSRA
jgi:SAM-dependent MidA family methyltransferase